MHNIVDLYSTILQGFILLLSGGIGTLHEDITSLVEGRDRINKPISTSAPALTVIIWQSISKTMSSTILLLGIVSMEVVCDKRKGRDIHGESVGTYLVTRDDVCIQQHVFGIRKGVGDVVLLG